MPTRCPAAMHDELADSDLAGLLQRIADNGIALVGLVAIGHEIVGLLPISAVDLGLIHEAHYVDSVLGLQFEVVKFCGVNQDMMPLGVFVAFDDFLLRNLHKLVSLAHAFDVTDRLAARLMDHAERHRFLVGDSGGELDGNEDEGQAEIARPERGRWHFGRKFT